MANLNELLIGLGYAVQPDIHTAPTTPAFFRLPNLNKKPWAQKIVNEDDAAEIGKGHEFPTQQFRSHYDNGVYTVERPASSEMLAHAFGFGLGKCVYASGAYTCTPIIPATNPTQLELPYFQFAQQIRPGGSSVLDLVYTGCAVKSVKLSVKAGPGRMSATITEELVNSGFYTAPSGITIPGAATWHEMQSDSLTLTINGVDYISEKSFESLDLTWDNNFRPGFFPQGGAGMVDGYATQGRLEIGDRVCGFTFVARYAHGSTELASAIGLTTGVATIGLSNGTADTFTGTFPKLSFKVAEIADANGIVTVQVTASPLYDDTATNPFSAVVKSSTAGICA
jgi:hypothetical protein